MARLGQFRRDTHTKWLALNPIIADGEFILVALDDSAPKNYRHWKVGNGTDKYEDLPLHQDATEGLKAYYVMSTPPENDNSLIWMDITPVIDGQDPNPDNPDAVIQARYKVFKDGQWIVIADPTKVDKEVGKVLSSNDYTDEDKARVNSFLSLIGQPDGIASLDGTGKVPETQLPSYMGSVESYANRDAFPATGVDGTIYYAEDSTLSYRYAGNGNYAQVGGIALGETATTAYPGNRGKLNADNIASLQSTKVDKVTGKQLSTNDFNNYHYVKLTDLAYIKTCTDGLTLDEVTGELYVTAFRNGFDYDELINKPKINGVELTGDVTLDQLGLTEYITNTVVNDTAWQNYLGTVLDLYVKKEQGKGLSTNDFTNEYKNKVDEVYTELTGVSTALEELEDASQ